MIAFNLLSLGRSSALLSIPSLSAFSPVCFLPASFRSLQEETKTKPSPTLCSSPMLCGFPPPPLVPPGGGITAVLLWGEVWSCPNGKMGMGTMGLRRHWGPSVGQSVFGALQRNVAWKFGGFPPFYCLLEGRGGGGQRHTWMFPTPGLLWCEPSPGTQNQTKPEPSWGALQVRV